jgi:hypothetical protein
MEKNITFSADENIISQANTTAKKRHTTLDVEFGRWLSGYAKSQKTKEYSILMDNLSYVCVGKKYSRDQLNER